jgi:hypothetical protein
MINKINLFNISAKFIFFLYLIVAFFNRSFIGIIFFNYRVGEYIVLCGFIFSLLICIFGIPRFVNQNLITFYRLIIVSFLLSAILNNANFLNIYTFKSSSYIWMISYFFIGSLFRGYEIKTKIPAYVIGLIALFSFIFSTGNYPNFIIDFFIDYSDKFQFTKASDSFMLIVAASLFINWTIKDNFFKTLFIYFISFLYLPLLLFQSRGSFIGLILFLIIESFYFRKYIFSNLKRLFLIILIAIIGSILGIYRISNVEVSKISEEPVVVLSETATKVIENKDTVDTLFSFYSSDGRIYSTDPTANWRLDIWQDILEDLELKNKMLIGYGYNEIIPVMVDGSAPGRLGKDGLNENVHNYFFTIISRGGLIQLLVFIFFYYHLLQDWIFKMSNKRLLSLLIPVFFVSSLDITMDGVHFPFIFFLTLGYILNTDYTKRYEIGI